MREREKGERERGGREERGERGREGEREGGREGLAYTFNYIDSAGVFISQLH